jgi:cysteine desulfurase NifS/selenium donor protein
MNPIYLDYNATTPVDREVAEVMKPFLGELFGNPSSTHEYGITAKKAVILARRQVAELINCQPDEIIFTSGGTESNNFAIKGVALANKFKGNHIITSSVEHPAVIEVCRYLSENGFYITYLTVDEYGLVDTSELEKAITSKTILITIMHANNEVGTIQPIEAIGKIARKNNILFHTDAAQSLGKIEVDVEKLGVDLLSVAGHKLYAPKGIGALYVRHGVILQKLIHGADHEMNKRAGTENVLEISGLGKACEIANRDLQKNGLHMKTMREILFEGIKNNLPEVKLNGHPEKRLPNTLSLSFPRVEANTLLSELTDVAASAGAACHTDNIEISSVLEAMKLPEEFAMGTIRFSTGKYSNKEEMEKAVGHIVDVVNRLHTPLGKVPEIPISTGEIKLTQFTHGLGCACKIRPQYLEKVLSDFPLPVDPNVLVSLSTSDDAAVYLIDENTAIIQTVDFFTPIVDDPYHFGAIAAANALSDVYAMGGKPLFALNIVGFPDNRLPVEVLKSILKGAQDKAMEAGVSILGGHTVEDTEPKYGMAVTGIIHPDKILTNSNAQPGDAIILTKPIGTGIISTAIKRGIADESTKQEVIRIMSELNAKAAEVMLKYPVNACTDVTGFGLLGHLKEMTASSHVDVNLVALNIPLIDGVKDLAANNIIPGGTVNNLEFVSGIMEWDAGISNTEKFIFCDAQTSGGLLIVIPGKYETALLTDLRKAGLQYAAIIGHADKRGNGKIKLHKK